MKRVWISILTFMTSSGLHALPVGNPWEASLQSVGVFWAGSCQETGATTSLSDAWSFRLGFYGDFVFDRHMQVDNKDSNAHLHKTTIATQAAYWAFNMWNRFDLFGTLGTTHIRLESPHSTFSNGTIPNTYALLDTDTSFSWSMGARGTLWECGCLGVGGAIQYLSARPPINFAHNAGLTSLVYQPSHVMVKYREWQVGLGASYRINIICDYTALLPYFAVRYARATMNMDRLMITDGGGTMTFFNLESDDFWGYAVGATLLGCNKISVTAEVRLISEKAFYINSQIRF
jgi:major outer membrane protein